MFANNHVSDNCLIPARMGNFCSGGLLDVDTNHHAGMYNDYAKYTAPHPLGNQVNNSIEQKRSSHSSSPERRRQGARDGTNTAGDELEVQQDESQWRTHVPASEQLPAEAAAPELPEEQPPEPFSWTKGELIGIGAFGRVFSALNNVTGELVAVKQVSFAKDEALQGRVAEHIRALEAEVRVLKTLKHENIVRYLGTEITDDSLYIFLEYVPGGSIASLLAKFGPFPEKVIRVYTAQLLRGLEYLHQKGIMHRDIKGANILVDKQGTVKLADFGASKKIEDLATMGSGSKSIRGTPYWMAPEVIKQTGHGRPADIWSLACTVIEMATGKPPWSTYTAPVAAMFQIASSKDPPPLPEHLSREAKDFLLLCFNRVARDRANATRLLKHPFIAGVLEQHRQLPTPGTPPGGAVVCSNSSNSPAAATSSGTGRALAGSSVLGAGDSAASSRLALPHSSRQGGVVTAAHKASVAGTIMNGQTAAKGTKQLRSSPTHQARNSPMRQQQHPAAETAPSGNTSCQRGDASALVVASRSPLQSQPQQPPVQQQLQQQQQHNSRFQEVAQGKQCQNKQSPKPFDSYNQQHAQQQPQAQQPAPRQQGGSRVSPPPAPSAEASGASEAGQEGCMTLVNWNPVSEPSWLPPYQPQQQSNSRRQQAAVGNCIEPQQQQPAGDKQQTGLHKGNSRGSLAADHFDIDCPKITSVPSKVSGIHSSSNGSIAAQHMKRSPLPMNNHSLGSSSISKRGTGSSGAGPLSQGPAGRGSSTMNGMNGALGYTPSGSILGGMAAGMAKQRPQGLQGSILQQHGANPVATTGSPKSATAVTGHPAVGQGVLTASSTAPAVVEDSITAHDQSAVGSSSGTAQCDEDINISSKRVQWENELYEELERHRQEQRVARQASQATRLAAAQQS